MEVTKYRSQLFIALERAGAHIRQAQNTLTRLRRDIVDRFRGLPEVLLPNATFENHLWNLLRRGQGTLTGLGRSVADKPRRLWEALRARENDVRKTLTTFRDGIRLANGKISKLRTHLYVAWGQVSARIQQGQSTLTGLGKRVIEKPRRLQKSLLMRENHLRKLLESSPDAIVVTNVEHRFVAANRKGLDLFGVSETNLRTFTIAPFLSRAQILEFQGIGSRLRKRGERHSKCEIRRLDGSLRIAEYTFVANFAPSQHVYRFRNIVTNHHHPFTGHTVANNLQEQGSHKSPEQQYSSGHAGADMEGRLLNHPDLS